MRSLLAAVTGAGSLAALLEKENQRAIGIAAVEPERVDLPHRLDPEPAGTALVGERAIDEPVAQNPAASLQSRDESSSPGGRPARRRRATLQPAAPILLHSGQQ